MTIVTAAESEQRILWDRKTDGGFPETKELKRRVRDVIEPGRDLGHVDRDHARESKKADERPVTDVQSSTTNVPCEDCK